jgi:subtilisin family serine protease
MRACLRAIAALSSLLAVSGITIAAPPAPATRSTVTLITGDRVTLGSGERPAVHLHPRKGREHIGFVTEQRLVPGDPNPQVYVIPEDARRLIAAHKIDRELFNITELAEAQRHASQAGSVPVIVKYSGSRLTSFSIAGTTETRPLSVINGVALKISAQESGRFWDTLTGATATLSLSSNAIEKIWLDRVIKTSLDRSVQQIGAPAAWNSGLQGDGVVIAVLDSGVDLSHPDLAGQVVAHQNFTAEADDVDHYGHGTHVASIIAGTGVASGGRYRGVAPRATLISAKVCNNLGRCLLSSVIEGMEWAVTQEGAKIVNLSIGGSNGPEIDPVEQAINQLSADYGVLFVAAAGNAAQFGEAVDTPAAADAALAVAAVDRADQLTVFSNRGPRAEGGAIKPEIAAPGADIVAARASGTELGPLVGNSYVALSGTSMATPHVTGAAALLAQLHPEWGPQQLKSALIGASKRNPALTSFEQGAGRVDIAAAIKTNVTAEPSTLGFGTLQWPHDDDVPVVRSITYHNGGAEPLTLTFTIDAKGPDGQNASPGMFTFSPATLTLPAGGTATATITADMRVNGPDGQYSGALIATMNGQSFIVPFAVERETEHYDVRVRYIDSAGAPSSDGSLSLSAWKDLRFYWPPDGPVDLRVPPGRYAFTALLAESQTRRLSAFNNAVLDVHADQNIVLDARNASAINLLPPKPSARRVAQDIQLNQRNELGVGFVQSFAAPVDWAIATQSFGLGDSSFISLLHAQWIDAGGGRSPSFYAAILPKYGSLMSGAQRMEVDKAATVYATYGSAFSNVTAAEHVVVGDFSGLAASGASASVALPQARIEFYYSPDKTVQWRNALHVLLDSSNELALESQLRELQPGRAYAMHWNEPPFAPGSAAAATLAVRGGDTLLFSISMFGDRGGHVGTIDAAMPNYELYANGQKVAEQSGFLVFDAPADRTAYTLVASAAQNFFRLSSSVTSEWQFSSEHVEGGMAADLPFLALQVRPLLNARGEAYRGLPFPIPVTVSQLAAQSSAQIRELFVEASFDDGKTWHKFAAAGRGTQWVALLKHPKQADFVSLRVTASDSDNNLVRQTLMRAYALVDPP